MEKSKLLHEADDLIHGDRAKAYGPVEENWGLTDGYMVGVFCLPEKTLNLLTELL